MKSTYFLPETAYENLRKAAGYRNAELYIAKALDRVQVRWQSRGHFGGVICTVSPSSGDAALAAARAELEAIRSENRFSVDYS